MTNKVLPKVFGWMFLGLLLTFATGYYLSLKPAAMMNILSTGGLMTIIIIELVVVLFLSFRIHKMSPLTAKICFMIYSIINGLTFSSIFLCYEMSSIIFVFLVAALVFGIFAVIGSVTKADLSSIGTYLFMALLGIIICMLFNMFFKSQSFDLIISCITVVVFVGLTAYDIQRIIKMNAYAALPEDNLAIFGAFQLYLDFINIFLELLKLFGRSNDN